MLALNADNYRYHDGLREALQLQPDAAGAWTDQQRRGLTALYDGLAEEHPQSSAVKRIPLDFKAGPPLCAQGILCVGHTAVSSSVKAVHMCMW